MVLVAMKKNQEEYVECKQQHVVKLVIEIIEQIVMEKSLLTKNKRF